MQQEGVVTVMFTDVEGSTDVTRRLGDEAARHLIEDYKRLVRDQLAAHDGREVDSIGDGFFITFSSTRRGVTCAVAIQKALAQHARERPTEQVRVRIGLNVGEVVERDGHPFGAAVNATERVAAHAKGGQILVSEPVRHLAGTVPGVTFRSRGRYALKGFSERWRLYELEWEKEAAPPPPRPATAPKPRRKKLMVVAAGIAVAGAAVAAALALLLGGDSGLSRIDVNSVGAIDPSSGEILDEIRVGAHPGSLALGEGGLWVANVDDRTVSRVDPDTLEQVNVIGTGRTTPSDVAVGEGFVWVPTQAGNELVVVSPQTNQLDRAISFPRGTGPAAVVVAGGFVWIANALANSVTRLTTATGVRASIKVGQAPTAIAAGEDGIWVVNSQSRSISRLDPGTGRVVRRNIALREPPSAIATGEGAVWVASAESDSITRIDPATDEAAQTIRVGNGPTALAAGAGGVWVANGLDRSVWEIDPSTNHVVRKISIGSSPQGVVVAKGRVWVTAGRP